MRLARLVTDLERRFEGEDLDEALVGYWEGEQDCPVFLGRPVESFLQGFIDGVREMYDGILSRLPEMPYEG